MIGSELEWWVWGGGAVLVEVGEKRRQKRKAEGVGCGMAGHVAA